MIKVETLSSPNAKSTATELVQKMIEQAVKQCLQKH
jgi:hypothetical protein